MIRKTGFVLAAASLLVGLAAIGYWMLFSNLALYDDEGYILISAREYFAHGGLYEFVYSQYGPAFFVLADGFQHLTGSPLDHTSARLLTLGLWLGAAGCCAALVQRQTASRALAGFTLTATFLYLYFITDEPFHPGSLIIFVLALSVWVITELIDRGRLAGAVAVAGGTGALLVLTKINVGVFYIAGLGAWAVLQTVAPRVRRTAGILVVVTLVLLAGALMHTLWRESWVQVYLVLFATGALTLVMALRPAALLKARHAALFIAVGASTALLILSAVWLRGTSFAGLVDGVLLGPLRHPGNYSYPVDWRPGSLALAGVSLLLAVAHPWIRRRFSEDAADRMVIVLRWVQAAALLAGIALLMDFRAVGAIFSYVAPLIWIWVVPLHGAPNPRPTQACRGLLAFVLLLQYLHAYPIGGSQESWATFLFMPLVALGLGEIRTWSPVRPAGSTVSPRRWTVLVSVILSGCILKAGWTAVTVHQRYAARSDLGLPGAEKLHLPESLASAYRLLALNAAVHADQLFSLPGMFSFNLWTDLPTPTRKNTTLWFTLLNDGEQSAIIRSIERSSRPCLIVQESLVQLMQAGNVPIRGILCDYLQRHFTTAFRTEGFAFLVRNGRTIAPLGLAQLTERATPTSAQNQPDTQLSVCLASDGVPIAAIETCDLSAATTPTLTLNSANTSATLVAINSANQPMGTPGNASWPLRFNGLARLSLQFNRHGAALAPAGTVFHLQDAQGRVLGEVRIKE
jgi:hypothetical protein